MESVTAAPVVSDAPRFATNRGGRRHGITLFVALSVANASNYLFHVIVSRMLDPSDYGALTALLSVFLILSIPAGAVQVTIARLVAERHDDESTISAVVRDGARRLGALGVVVALLLTAAAPLVSSFLHLGSLAAALMLAAFALPTFAASVYQGALQGSERFGRLAGAIVAATFLRIIAGVALVYAGAGVTGAAGASALSQLVLAVVAWRLFAAGRRAHTSIDRIPGLWRDCAWTAFALTGFWVLISLDVILARHYLGRHESGLYGAAVTLSRLVLFAPGAIALVAFPRFTANALDPRKLRESVIGSVTLVAFIGACAALAIGIFPRLAIRVLFGESYLAAAPIVRMLAAAMIMLGIATIYLYYHLATRSRAAFIFWGAAVLEVSLIVAFHAQGKEIAGIVSLVAFGVLLLQSTTVPQNPPLSSKDTELWLLPAPELDLTVVTPAYNSAAYVAGTVTRLGSALKTTGLSHEIIVVSDGSTDGTGDVVRAMEADGLRLIDYERRQGKGEALRRGIVRARGKYVAFIDADGDLHPQELEHFVMLMETYGADIVLGSKRHPMSDVHYPLMRRVMSSTYQVLIRVLFGLKVRDTQTGMKLMRREVLADVLPRMMEKRFAFDLEMLVVARSLGYRKLFEAPIRLEYQFQSTVSPKAVSRIMLDTAAIWYRRFVLRSYDAPRQLAVMPDSDAALSPVR